MLHAEHRRKRKYTKKQLHVWSPVPSRVKLWSRRCQEGIAKESSQRRSEESKELLLLDLRLGRLEHDGHPLLKGHRAGPGQVGVWWVGWWCNARARVCMTVTKRHYNSGCLLLPVEGSLPVATQREQPLVILLGQHLACQSRITQRMHGVVQCTVHCTQCAPIQLPKG